MLELYLLGFMGIIVVGVVAKEYETKILDRISKWLEE